MDCILCQTLKIILSIFKKKHGGNTNKPSVHIYVSKIENRVTFNFRNGYSIEL